MPDEALERLGVKTLEELAALPTAALADRFGKAGLTLAIAAIQPNATACNPSPAAVNSRLPNRSGEEAG
jgi:hypothetical protein